MKKSSDLVYYKCRLCWYETTKPGPATVAGCPKCGSRTLVPIPKMK